MIYLFGRVDYPGPVLSNAMMFGIVGAVLSLLFALFLPETAGRKFTVIEGKEHG